MTRFTNHDDLLLNYIQNITSSHHTLTTMVNVLTHQEKNINNLIAFTRERERRISNNNRNRNILQQSFIRQPTTIPTGQQFNLPVNFPSSNINNINNINNRNNRNNRNIGNIGNNRNIRNTRNTRNIDLINDSIIYNTFSNINNPINNSCPINREVFNADDSVIQIIPCGHVFNESGLLRWFENNNTCPLCRYNLLNQTTATDNGENTPNTSNTSNTSNNQTHAEPSAQTHAEPSAQTHSEPRAQTHAQTQTQSQPVNIASTTNNPNSVLTDNILNMISENILNEINNLSDLSGNITSDISGNANEISFILPVFDYRG